MTGRKEVQSVKGFESIEVGTYEADIGTDTLEITIYGKDGNRADVEIIDKEPEAVRERLAEALKEVRSR